MHAFNKKYDGDLGQSRSILWLENRNSKISQSSQQQQSKMVYRQCWEAAKKTAGAFVWIFLLHCLVWFAVTNLPVLNHSEFNVAQDSPSAASKFKWVFIVFGGAFPQRRARFPAAPNAAVFSFSFPTSEWTSAHRNPKISQSSQQQQS